MGWSEWIQPADVQVDARWRFFTRTFVIRTPEGEPPAVNEGEPFYSVERLDGTPGGFGTYNPNLLDATWSGYPGDQPGRTHIQFLVDDTIPPNSELIPPSLPPDFFTHTTGGTPFEYEAAESTHLGWAWGGPAEIVSRTGSPEEGTVELIVPSDYFTHGAPGYDMTDHPTYPLPNGTVVATFGASDPVGTTLGTLPDPGPVPGFAVVIDVTNPGVDASVAVNIGDLYARIRYPRWRYWIEGSKVRQVHRDDGFGITPKRARGASSRGATNRARAYD